MRQVATGDTVRVHYTGTLDDGTEFDTSTDRDPIAFMIGGGQVLPGFENALVGMTEGETKSITLSPEDAYGPHDAELLHAVERERIPDEIDLKVGALLQAGDAQSNEITLRVVEVSDEMATLDANHPLAGETLTFELTMVAFGE
tara:strand:+ start:50 stop:481 length:432 start_codon:yes stop_codon:yes gene_type:complete